MAATRLVAVEMVATRTAPAGMAEMVATRVAAGIKEKRRFAVKGIQEQQPVQVDDLAMMDWYHREE